MTPSTTNTKLSPLHDEMAHLNAKLADLGGMQIAARYGDGAGEAAKAAELGLCDVSSLARMVLKGPSAAATLNAARVTIPGEIMQVASLDGGGVIARTGSAEFFVEDGPNGSIVARIEDALCSAPAGCYPVLKQDASILVSGRRASELFLETCAYDFRRPGEKLVMTRVVGVSCSILARSFQEIPVFQLWLDGTYGGYLWETLLEIVHDLGGDAVGAAVFFPDSFRSA